MNKFYQNFVKLALLCFVLTVLWVQAPHPSRPSHPSRPYSGDGDGDGGSYGVGDDDHGLRPVKFTGGKVEEVEVGVRVGANKEQEETISLKTETHTEAHTETTGKTTSLNSALKKRLVVASMSGDKTAWISKRLSDWEALVYVADDPSADLRVPLNKGHESMVYLTYIIDHYDDEDGDGGGGGGGLADVQVFMHSLQYQWHNDDSNKDGATMISRLQLPYVQEQGYVNLRCAWPIGCPAEIQLDDGGSNIIAAAKKGEEGNNSEKFTGQLFRQAFMELFPERAAKNEIPTVVGVSCCAQFAVTKAKLKEIPLSEYIRIRDWVINTELSDYESGRIMEYSWHMLFGQPDVHCPKAQDCYCNVFGLCGLQNCNAGTCEGQYTLPQFSTMPEGWKPLAVYEQAD